MAAIMTYILDATHISKASLPVIEVAGLSSSNPANRRHVAEALRRACLDKGFFYVSNHGIPAGLIDAVFEEARRFFNLNAEAKSAVDKSRSFCNRGYEPLRAQTLEAGAPPDLKESFYMGPNCRWTIRELRRVGLTGAPISASRHAGLPSNHAGVFRRPARSRRTVDAGPRTLARSS